VKVTSTLEENKRISSKYHNRKGLLKQALTVKEE
jgi:hypothetical protein